MFRRWGSSPAAAEGATVLAPPLCAGRRRFEAAVLPPPLFLRRFQLPLRERGARLLASRIRGFRCCCVGAGTSVTWN